MTLCYSQESHTRCRAEVNKNLPDHLMPSDISAHRNRDMERIDN